MTTITAAVALSAIQSDFSKSGKSVSNYSDGEYTQDYRTRSEFVKLGLEDYGRLSRENDVLRDALRACVENLTTSGAIRIYDNANNPYHLAELARLTKYNGTSEANS